VQFGYGLNYLIDTAHAVIVDVEAAPARTYDEVAATRTMLERTHRRLDLKPRRLAADTAYGTGKFLGFLKTQKIAPHIPVWDKAQRTDGTFSRSDFTYDAELDVYTCPTGKTLRSTGVDRRGVIGPIGAICRWKIDPLQRWPRCLCAAMAGGQRRCTLVGSTFGSGRRRARPLRPAMTRSGRPECENTAARPAWADLTLLCTR
jgi:hypothetical protein